MTGRPDLAADLGRWLLLGLWVLALLAAPLLTLLGLSGNFVIVGLALLHALATGFAPLTWPFLLLLLGLALLGEVVEAVVGTLYVARKGATRHGVLGAFAGGLAGAVAGGAVVPVLGAVAGGFLGSFLGAVAGQYLHERRLEPSLRVGWHAFAGKTLASLFKVALSAAMIALILMKVLA
ncbi:MAG: DUF456 domain-containing protein [bacterium]|nr:DUF456 domain-containing protein [bacterium]